jgi:hypothetical protein
LIVFKGSEEILCGNVSVRMGYNSEDGSIQAGGMGFGGNVKWPDCKGRFRSFVGAEIVAINRAGVEDSAVTASPSGPGSYPETF